MNKSILIGLLLAGASAAAVTAMVRPWWHSELPHLPARASTVAPADTTSSTPVTAASSQKKGPLLYLAVDLTSAASDVVDEGRVLSARITPGEPAGQCDGVKLGVRSFYRSRLGVAEGEGSARATLSSRVCVPVSGSVTLDNSPSSNAVFDDSLVPSVSWEEEVRPEAQIALLAIKSDAGEYLVAAGSAGWARCLDTDCLEVEGAISTAHNVLRAPREGATLLIPTSWRGKRMATLLAK